MKIKYKKIHPAAKTPEYKTAGAAAFDLSIVEDIDIPPHGLAKARTGLVIATPPGHALILAARSSAAAKFGIMLANGIGVVDSDYCGPEDEILISLFNLRNETAHLKAGDRIAQALIVPIVKGEMEAVDFIAAKNRGGFGSTGHQ
ncbi:dUTP diphosphatase [Candidatus Parcubacteria bacterium]|nr:MAG: dUTP diphosphatase [Candidatus Parcubacteria bacterium]